LQKNKGCSALYPALSEEIVRGLTVFLDAYGFIQADVMGVSEADGYLAAQINGAKRAAKKQVRPEESSSILIDHSFTPSPDTQGENFCLCHLHNSQ